MREARDTWEGNHTVMDATSLPTPGMPKRIHSSVAGGRKNSRESSWESQSLMGFRTPADAVLEIKVRALCTLDKRSPN